MSRGLKDYLDDYEPLSSAQNITSNADFGPWDNFNTPNLLNV